ncbi:Stk1 family PASTA domain-containing Ser/Thr kinase [soil metagenome]
MHDTVVHGRYSVTRTLGGGGMARVYLAHDEVLGRDVALKILRDQYAEDAEFAERFKREARSAASLSHPNIVSVYDRGVAEDGTSYIAMEHVAGGSLKERISQEGHLAPESAASIALQITDALEAAHERGVIHRDIKPHNVLLTPTGDVKVADFGIARAASSTSISHTSLVLGTASYMSPEQAMGQSVDPRSDLYSLGVVLYEMLTGELPYNADNPVAVSMKHVNESLVPARELNPKIPQGMDAIVTKLLSKEPDARYESASELAGDLRRVRDGMGPMAAGAASASSASTRSMTRKMPPPPPPVAHRRRRSSTPWVLAAILMLLVLLGGLAWALTQNNGVEVPDVNGMSQEEAQQRLEASGFQVDAQQQESSAEETGLVVDQSPSARSSARDGSTVTLQIGSGPPEPSTVSVPEVRSITLADAEAVLGQAGLAVGKVREIPSNTAAEGFVIEQGFAPGAEVDPGTAVNLGVSSGPPPAPSTPEEPQQEPQQQQDRQEDLEDNIKDQVKDALNDSKDDKKDTGGKDEKDGKVKEN